MLQKSTRRLLSILWVILLSLTSVSASDYVSLCGSVVESLAHSPLYGARVALLDSGYLELDTAIARQKMQGIGTMPAEFKLRCNKTPGIYYLMIECDGYDPLAQFSNVVYNVNARGRTVISYNVVLRFVLFHAVSEFDIKPKPV